MSELYECTRYGDKRRSTWTFAKGQKCYIDGADYHFKETTVVDITEIYNSVDGERKWRLYEYHWATARPASPPPPKPAPPPKPPGFWARLFKRNKLPTATLVKG